MEDSANLDDPDVIAAEIVEDLRAALGVGPLKRFLCLSLAVGARFVFHAFI